MSLSKEDPENLADQLVYFSLRLSSPAAFASVVDEAFAHADPDEAQFLPIPKAKQPNPVRIPCYSYPCQ
jgi:hypothetical protein